MDVPKSLGDILQSLEDIRKSFRKARKWLPVSIFREQIIQIRGGEAAGKAFLAQHVGNRLRLALLQFPDFFLDGAGRDEAVGVHGLRLADAMRTVNGLRLDR